MSEVKQIVIASNNQGKLREIRALFADHPVQIITQSEFAISEVEETGLSFVENAILKARHACAQSGLAAIADDSGIEVDVLNGRPGIYSARFAGKGASDEDNLQLLLESVKPFRDRQIDARFQCVMVYLRHAEDPVPVIAQAAWNGAITAEPKGKNGFGYDPVFYVSDHECTSAELAADVKNRISHRGQALRKLLQKLSNMI
ncbi:MAG: RdgB/HAM1 family non-canonical purine NTP pyrophosphatase [Gammaproteobacteria bacterium]|nr:RdgB/HAM1 family non-canonical purine NTP pyrophosphatase [Gammaproteobacteria bacterium]